MGVFAGGVDVGGALRRRVETDTVGGVARGGDKGAGALDRRAKDVT